MFGKNRLTLGVLAGVLAFAGFADAATVRVGNSFGTRAGEFLVRVESGSLGFTPAQLPAALADASRVGLWAGAFESFCLEKDEYLNFTSPFAVKNISVASEDGGVNVVGVGSDPLDPRTAWLYAQFLAGTLSGYDYTPTDGRVASANSLQVAIWKIEQEIDWTLSGGSKAFYDLATAANPTSLANVRVLNINSMKKVWVNGIQQWVDSGTPAQSLLVMVPTPSAALGGLMLLGMIGGLRMARNRRQTSTLD